MYTINNQMTEEVENCTNQSEQKGRNINDPFSYKNIVIEILSIFFCAISIFYFCYIFLGDTSDESINRISYGKNIFEIYNGYRYSPLFQEIELLRNYTIREFESINHSIKLLKNENEYLIENIHSQKLYNFIILALIFNLIILYIKKQNLF